MKKNSEKQWSEKIQQHKTSGKSAHLWCQEQGISYQSSLSWRKRLPSVDITKGSPLVEIFEDSSEATWMEISTKGVNPSSVSLSREIWMKFDGFATTS